MTTGLDPITRAGATSSGGDVVGPPSAVNNRIVVFDSTTGKLIKDGGSTIADIVAGSGGLVTSVFGRVGAIVSATDDYTWAQIDKTTSSLADLTTRSASDLSSGILVSARMPALTGDVTSTAGSVTTIIANNAVSLAKLADIATASFLGRNTAGTGDPEVLSVATAKTMLNLAGTNTGDVTLTGETYLSLSLTGQALTANQISLSGSHVTNTLPVTKGGTGTATQFTAGSVVFAGASGVYGQDNANLFWDDANNRLGLRTATPSEALEVAGNVFINSATANLYLKDTSTGWQSASTTVVTPLNNNNIRSTNYTSGLIGWNISALGNAEFNNVDVRGAIHAAIITYNAIAATAGTLGVFKSAAKLKLDVTIPASPTYGTTTVDVSVVDPEGLSHASSQVFVGNDILRIKDGLVGDTWLKVSAIVDDGTNYRYGCIIMAGSNNVTYRAGLGVADYGPSGQGFIIQTADQTNSPYLQMATHASSFSASSSAGTLNVTPRLRVGNLNGSYGYATDTYGFGTGQYGTSGQSWVTVDATNGVRLGNNTTTRVHLAADGSGFLANGNISWTTAGVASISGWTINSTSVSSSTTYLASNLDPPAGQVTWYGKSATGYQGLFIRDASSRQIDMLVGNSTIYPYLRIYDGTRARVVLGGLNNAWGADGSTNSMGMKIWSSAGSLLVEFSDVQNIIAGWSIASGKISSTGIDINSGATAGLAFGATPPTSASAGTGIWLDRTGLYGLAASVAQATFDALTGALTAGAGNVTLDSTGVKFISGVASTNQIKWMDTTNIGGFMYHDLGVTHDMTALGSVSYTNNKNARTSISAQGTSGISGSLEVNASGTTFSTPASKVWITMYQNGGISADFLGVVIGNNSIPTFSGTGPTLEIHGNGFRVVTSRTPASATAAGNAGEFAWDTSFIYICTATNSWKRAALSSW